MRNAGIRLEMLVEPIDHSLLDISLEAIEMYPPARSQILGSGCLRCCRSTASKISLLDYHMVACSDCQDIALDYLALAQSLPLHEMFLFQSMGLNWHLMHSSQA